VNAIASVLAASAIVFVPMLVEARRAARNERAQRAIGGIEPNGDVYDLMRFAYPLAFLLMIGEGVLEGPPSVIVFAFGTALFVVAKALKWWAILTLGPRWTFRVIVVPGSRLVTNGPYRFLSHPNYVGVVGELVAVSLMTGARVTGPLVTVAFGLLILRRVVVERRALDAILRRN
jgi:methyltransferase